MSRLEDLIQTLCPDGVEYKNLGEVCSIVRGVTYSKSAEVNSTIGQKILRANNITLSTNTVNFDDIKVISDSVKLNPNQMLRKNDILICTASGSKAHIGKVAFIDQDLDCYFGGFMAVIRTNSTLLSRFMFHLLVGLSFSSYLENTLNSSTINNLNSTILSGFRVPIPPLPVQEEIVRILDTFSGVVEELEQKLNAEQAARVRQYEHYRNYLLVNHRMFDNGIDLFHVPEHSLDEVCLQVSNIRWNESGGKTFRYIDLTSTDRATKTIQDTVTITSKNAPSRAQQIVKINDVIFGSTRPTLKRYAFITDEYDGEICSTGFCVLRSDPKQILPKYLYFQISSTAFEDHVEKYQRGSAYPAITDKDLKSFRIPVPPLEVQEQIVSILDRFDALVNDLKSGLPAEIALRRKQYEYYRNKLLTFKPIQPPPGRGSAS